jgi:hypothetical protein
MACHSPMTASEAKAALFGPRGDAGAGPEADIGWFAM